MKKRKFPWITWLFLVVFLVSLSVVVIARVRLHRGAAQCQATAEKLQQLLPDPVPALPDGYADPAMPVLQAEGVDYVALIRIPAWDITLPVANNWDGNRLHAGPRRFYGSAYDSSLVIGGADHPRQFAFCRQIRHGEEIILTDMTGAQFTYTVTRIDRSPGAEKQWLMDEAFDLTLFCRDGGFMEYIAVRCTLTT